MFTLWQCQSQVCIKEEGDANPLCYGSVVKLHILRDRCKLSKRSGAAIAVYGQEQKVPRGPLFGVAKYVTLRSYDILSI